MRMANLWVLAILLGGAPRAWAQDPAAQVIRFGTIAPEGSVWAAELKTFSNEVNQLTGGHVRIKWYWGGAIGDEEVMAGRVQKQQLDGIGGCMICQQVAPSLRVMFFPGLFQNPEEATHVQRQLRTLVEKEANENGYALLAAPSMGPSVMFSKVPVRSLAEARKLRWWAWRLDTAKISLGREMGLTIVPTAVDEAKASYDAGQVDGFLATPASALAFQWSTRARYLIPLRVGQLQGCVFIANRVFERLPVEYQQVFRSASAKVELRLEERLRTMEDALLGGLFEKHGLTAIPVSDSFRAEFFAAARTARERMGERLVPAQLLDRVLRLLADFRSEHGLAIH